METQLKNVIDACNSLIKEAERQGGVFKLPTGSDLLHFRQRHKLKLQFVVKHSEVSLLNILQIERGEDVPYSNWLSLCEFYNSYAQDPKQFLHDQTPKP